jgi:hypothetical protein
MLPVHVGAPLGQEHGGSTYFMIEMHYENPEGRTCEYMTELDKPSSLILLMTFVVSYV